MRRPVRSRTRRQSLIVLFFGVLVAGCYFLADRPAAIWARGLDPQIVAIFDNVTLLGAYGPYLIVLAALYPVLRFLLRRGTSAKRALFIFTAIVISGSAVDLIKPVAARWRPAALFAEPSRYGFELFELGSVHYSFPSGHAATASAVACALSLLYPRLRALWIGIAALVASSRVIVGEHYPGDVLAGAWFGIVMTLALGRTAWFRDARASPPGATEPRNPSATGIGRGA